MAVYHADRFTLEIKLKDCVGIMGPGDVTEECEYIAGRPYVAKQLDRIGDDNIRAELHEYTDGFDVGDSHEIRLRVVWIAASDIWEQASPAARKRAKWRQT